MPTTPSQSQFQPPGPIGFDNWHPRFLQTLNQFIVETVRSLVELQASGPSYRTLNISTGATVALSFPIVFPNPLNRTPQDVHVAKVSLVTGDVLGPVTCLWSHTSLGQIQIDDVTNLDASSQYEVTLSVS